MHSSDCRAKGKNPEEKIIESGTALPTTPKTLPADIHDRMPIIVTPDKYDQRLDLKGEDFDAVREILKPYDPSLVRHYPGSLRLKPETQFRAE